MNPSAAACPVDEAAFRRSLEIVKRAPIDPARGLFGPDSMFWEVNRHTLVYFLGAVQSVQMQLCHPWIATAVYEHSKIMSNPRQRARLTYIYLWSLIYGNLDTAMKKAQSLYRVHERVQGNIGETAGAHVSGSAYRANEVNALLWVHVTAFVCRVRLYERLVRPLTPEQKDRFVREAKLYAFCFGIPESVHPDNWQEVEEYVAAMAASDTLARTEPGLKIRRFLENHIPESLRGPIWNFLCVPLPERLQALLDQPRATPENLARAACTTRLLKILQWLLPAKLAYVPAWHEARRRLAGKTGPDWFTAKLNTAFLGIPRLVS
jgi:uncharacterized protein (DUF2236 family)